MALKYLPQFKTTTLNVGGGIDASQTTGIILQSVTGVDISKPGVICINWANPLDTDVAEWITYTSIDGSNELQGVVRGAEGSTGRVHANNVAIAFPVSKSHINDLNDVFLVGHNEGGASAGDITADTDGATITFSMATSNLHTVTLGGNRILAVSNVSVGQCFIIRLVQDGAGSRTVTWFSTIKWAGGSAPTLTTTLNKTDVFGFLCTSSGNYDGFVVGQNL